MRFHLIDRIDKICYGKYIEGVKCITLADDVFNEHFPGYPVFPGTLIIEGLAQLSGSFFEMMMKHNELPTKRSVLSIVNYFKIKRPARPGDKLIYTASIETMADEYGVAKVKATVDGKLVANGELLFSFIEINDAKLQASREELYQICMADVEVIE